MHGSGSAGAQAVGADEVGVKAEALHVERADGAFYGCADVSRAGDCAFGGGWEEGSDVLIGVFGVLSDCSHAVDECSYGAYGESGFVVVDGLTGYSIFLALDYECGCCAVGEEVRAW